MYSMKTNATDFRANLFAWLDRIASSGEHLEIERKGVTIRVERADHEPKLSRLKRRDTMISTRDEIADQGFSESWEP
jgi:hypothetical protein